MAFSKRFAKKNHTQRAFAYTKNSVSNKYSKLLKAIVHCCHLKDLMLNNNITSFHAVSLAEIILLEVYQYSLCALLESILKRFKLNSLTWFYFLFLCGADAIHTS